MKIIIALLLSALCVSAQPIITASVTVTNIAGTTNGQTISVNGVVRTFTNNVTFANVQISTATNTTLVASNIFVAYASFPQPNMSLFTFPQSSVLFQSYPGSAMTVLISPGWGALSYSTNSLSSATVMRAPITVAGPFEITNVANAIRDYISSQAVTNQIPTNAPAMQLFKPFDSNILNNAVANLGTNSTNFTLMMGLNGTNYVNFVTSLQSNFFWSVVGGIGSAAYQPVTAFQPASTTLSNISGLDLSQLVPWLTNNAIVLYNTNALDGSQIFRLEAQPLGPMRLYYADAGANPFLTVNGPSEGSPNDIAIKALSSGVTRIEIQQPENNGQTILRDSAGDNSLTITKTSGNVLLKKPITFNTVSLPGVAMGLVTNFVNQTAYSGSGSGELNTFTIPSGVLTNIGDTIIRRIGAGISGSGGGKIEVDFAGGSIGDTGSIATTSTGSIYVQCEITVIDDTDVGVVVSTTSQGTASATTTVCQKLSVDSLTSNAHDFQLKLYTTGGDTVTIFTDNIYYAPSPAWAGLQ
jgi:hypothetical protein